MWSAETAFFKLFLLIKTEIFISDVEITKILKGGKVVSEIKQDKIKLSNEPKPDKKTAAKKEKVLSKPVEKKTTVKIKGKK